jgi:hypothetical protein
VNVLVVGEAGQETVCSLRLTDIGVIFKGSTNLSNSSEELSLFSINLIMFFALFLSEFYFLFFDNFGDFNSCIFTKSEL